MGTKNSLPSDEMLIASAKEYVDKRHIRSENILLYDRIIRRKLSKIAFSHMPKRSSRTKEIEGGWTIEKLKSEIAQYEYLCDFRNNSANAYAAIIRRKLKHLIKHLKTGQHVRTDEELERDAALCNSPQEFKTRFPNSHAVALRREPAFIDKIYSKMKGAKRKESLAEIALLSWVKTKYPQAHKTRIYYINEKGKRTYYEYDILIPELKIAIEYQGLRWHSDKMTKGDPDRTFKKVELAKKNGIRLIVIFEDDWEKNQLIVKNRLTLTFEKRDADGILNYIKLLKKVEGVPAQQYLFESSNAWQDDFVYINAGMELVKEIPPKEFFIKNKKRVEKNDTNKDLPKIRDMGGKIWKIVL